MRYTGLLFAAFLLLYLISVQVHAQQVYTVVYDLYYQLTLYPENGDGLIEKNRALFDPRFYSCLKVVQERAAQTSRQHMGYCNRLENPQSQAECARNDEAGKFWTWTRTIRAVTREEVRWSETHQGQAAVMGKNALESLNPGYYEKIIRSTVPNWKPILICQ